MDSIDEWLKRTMGTSAPKSESTKKSSGDEGKNILKPKRKFFSKRKQSDNEKTLNHQKSNLTSSTNKNSQQANLNNQKGKSTINSNYKTKSTMNKSNNKQQHINASNKTKQSKIKDLKRGERLRLPQAKPTKKPPMLRGKVKIIPLGGLNEVGKNMMAIEYENDIIIIDMGFEFPGGDLLGVDYVIPDVSYLEENKHKIRGVVLTHGHLDHIGGIPYILPKLNFPPLFGARLTMGFVEEKMKEFKFEKTAKLHTINPDKPLKLGNFVVNFIRIAHSIPDALTLVIDTPVGKLVHTGDFKFDEHPARNIAKADIHKLEALTNQDVLALLCESTNAMVPGHTISEREVGVALEKAVGEVRGRVIIASFSSQIGRVQQIIDAAVKNNRKIFVGGRSMKNNINISAKLGYLKIPQGVIEDLKKYKQKESPDDRTLIITTGSQGEDMAALARIARGEHQQIRIKKGDTIIFSSSPIPGNETAINKVINNLAILGAKIIHNKMVDVHTSGHAKQDELTRMINLVKPKYLVPIHGEFYMRQSLGNLAIERCGIPENKVIMIQNGDVLIAERGKVSRSPNSIDTKYILIDGRGEGQMGSQVIVDRETMSQNGALIAVVKVTKKTRRLKGNVDIISRGFTYSHEIDEIARELSDLAREAYKKIRAKNPGAKRGEIKKFIRQTLDKFTHKQLDRSPLIIPVIIEC